jgi:LuxR family transcriptional regulator, maltose regulon positive regulatory protein
MLSGFHAYSCIIMEGKELCMGQPAQRNDVVSDTLLVHRGEAQAVTIPVGSPAWYAWLEQVHSFSFSNDEGTFTAHKARSSNRRGGWYWYAYRRRQGQLFRCYLGASSRLTLACLRNAARQLACRVEGSPHQPSLSPDVPTPLPLHAEPHTDQTPPALLATKFRIPGLPVHSVARSHLLSLLDEGTKALLTLVCASAGFGKTTLLSAWASQTPGHVAWLTLDEQDNDPTRFWIAVMTALRTCLPTLGEAAFSLLHSLQPPPLITTLTGLLNDLAAVSEDTVLILDDYHVIEEPALHESLLFLLDHLPGTLHLVLATRVDPPLALSRWRARGQMREIRDSDLRFSEQDGALFLSQTMGLHLEEEDVVLLTERTEGWIAGLQLAALSLRGHNDPSVFLKRLSGSHRFLLDYVQEEILARQPAAIQRFLLHVAVLPQMNASLCQTLTEETASQERLESLERSNLFLVPLDEERQWYRFHPLFREALLARLQASQPEHVPLLHRRAADWYAARGLWHEAIPYAFEAEDFAEAADLLERCIDSGIWRNEYHTLHRWLVRLPQEVLHAHPQLSFVYALAADLTSPGKLISQRGLQSLEQAKTPLQWAEQGYRAASNQAGLGAVLTVRAMLAAHQGAFTHAFALARQALSLLPEDDRHWRGGCLIIQGAEAALFDQSPLARQLLRQGLALSESVGWVPNMQIAMALLGDVCVASGELHLAVHYFRRTLASSDEWTGDGEIFYECLALYDLAALAYEWNTLAEAESYMHQALRQGQFLWLHLLIPGLLLQVRLLHTCGKADQAWESLCEFAAQTHRPDILREIQLCQAYLALKMGDLATAQQWAAASRQADDFFPRVRQEEEALLLAHLRLAEGQPEVVPGLLEPWKQGACTNGRLHSELQILVVLALAYEASGQRVQAHQALLEALTKARREGYQRLFLDEGQAMEMLLKTLLPDVREQALASYVRALLRAFSSTSAGQGALEARSTSLLLEPLTPQEQRVLRLLAEGASNQHIATQLVIELSTARKHVSNLLSKLGAANRTQAIARAREYALL